MTPAFVVKTGFAVFDRETRQPYIRVLWTKQEAEDELLGLTRHLGKDNPWRDRLYVAPWAIKRRRPAKAT